MKICPACSNQYSDDANFCPMDASRLPEPLVAAAMATALPATTMRDSSRSVANRFLLGERIAITSTGEVFQATDGNTNEVVRLKMIDSKALPTPMIADRALREFKQLAKVKSDRIVRVVDQGKLDDGRLYVATEAVEGDTLDEVVAREGALSFERSKAVVLAVGEALTEAQKVGVIHRDVAPRNVIIVGDKVKLGEFGVAEPVTDRVFGTPAFLSPEQAEGKPVDQRSNIYSLGALFYYVLTGGAPFEGDSDALIQQHLHTQPKAPGQRRQGLTAEIDKLVLKALEKSGGRRHLTLRQLLNEIDALPAPASLAPVAPRPEGAAATAAAAATGAAAATAMSGGEAEVDSLGGATVPSMAAVTDMTERMSPSALASVAKVSPVVDQATPVKVAAVASAAAEKPVEPTADTLKPPVKQAPTQVTPARTGPAAATVRQPIQKQPAAQQAGKPKAGGKAGFRETGWFKKGELEEEMAKRAAQEAAKNPDDPLAGGQQEVVVDDSSLTAEDRARLSLKTGSTQAMPIIKGPAPSQALPGDRMSDEDMLSEAEGSKKWIFVAGGVLALLAVLAAVYFLAFSGGNSAAPATGVAPPSPPGAPASK